MVDLAGTTAVARGMRGAARPSAEPVLHPRFSPGCPEPLDQPWLPSGWWLLPAAVAGAGLWYVMIKALVGVFF